MRPVRPQPRRAARGMTLVELVVAAGLMTILILTLLKLVDDFDAPELAPVRQAFEFAPPLTIQKEEIDEALKIIEECIGEEEKAMGL